jgi:16S rRNA (guanine527-N7)-methyltransferase
MNITPEMQLQQGLNSINLSLSEAQRSKLLDYIELMRKWNQSFNLTAITNPASMISHHLLDSLIIAPYLKGQQHIDVGSGAGLPGIPLAIALPEQQFTLLDSNGKKTRFLLQAKLHLQLNNIQVVQKRVEDYQPNILFDNVLSRAFASISDMLNWSEHLCKPNGHFLALKGQFPDKELASLPTGFKVDSAHSLLVPGIEGQRHLLIIQKTSD